MSLWKPTPDLATAPETGIEPMNSSFRARCSDQQLLLRRFKSNHQQHSVRELNPTCELQRLTSRLRAGESLPDRRVSCGSRTRLSELEAQHLCRSAKDTWMRKFEGRSVKRSELFHTSRFTLQTSRSSGGRTRTFTRLLNREPPYHWATPDCCLLKSGWLDLNQRSRVSGTRGVPDFPTS